MSKYVDIPSVIQVIGAIYNSPSLLDEDDKYFFNEEDFTEEFHKILFGSIYNLHALGAKEISLNAIEDYLEQRPKKLAIYKSNKGPEYIQKISQTAQLAAFDYYYGRMKKMTLMRMYHEVAGMDLSWLYDIDNILDIKKKQAQEDWLDNTSIEEIADLIDKKITDVRLTYADNAQSTLTNAGEGALELLERLKETPELGYPLFGPLINTISRGARLKKFYLRSAATGVGKTRSMIADVCSIACDKIYDSEQKKWIENGTKEPAMFITTEQELDEIQTMMIAFLSDVDEEHIINGEYFVGEWDRVVYAANLLKKCPLYVEQLPDFSLKDIENTILFMISIRLKDICNQYGVFIMTATQLNADYRTAEQYDQNLLRGAKSIADKIDLGLIMLEASQNDLTALAEVIKGGGFQNPQIKISVYKNRRGRYKDILLWCKANRGTCKIEPMFATNYQYELIPIDDLKITIKPKIESSAF